MAKPLSLFSLFLLLIFSGANFAHASCDNADTQTNMNICAYDAYKKSDEALNKIYQKALKILTDTDQNTQKNLLVISQRAWIKYRDTACEFEGAGYEGGTMQPMIHASCMKSLTDERSKKISNAFQEWDADENPS